MKTICKRLMAAVLTATLLLSCFVVASADDASAAQQVVDAINDLSKESVSFHNCDTLTNVVNINSGNNTMALAEGQGVDGGNAVIFQKNSADTKEHTPAFRFGDGVNTANALSIDFDIYLSDGITFADGGWVNFCVQSGFANESDSNRYIKISIADIVKSWTAGEWNHVSIDISKEAAKANIAKQIAIRFYKIFAGSASDYFIIDNINIISTKTVTYADKAAVEAVGAAYDALTDAQKALVTNVAKLQGYQAMIATIENNAKAVSDAICALPAVEAITLDNAEEIAEVRASYADLTEEEKALVTNLDVLVAAEARISQLSSPEMKAQPVIDAIDNLPSLETISAADADAVQAARAAYDALEQEAKDVVTNYADLVAAEQKIVDLIGVEKLQTMIDDLHKVVVPFHNADVADSSVVNINSGAYAVATETANKTQGNGSIKVSAKNAVTKNAFSIGFRAKAVTLNDYETMTFDMYIPEGTTVPSDTYGYVYYANKHVTNQDDRVWRYEIKAQALAAKAGEWTTITVPVADANYSGIVQISIRLAITAPKDGYVLLDNIVFNSTSDEITYAQKDAVLAAKAVYDTLSDEAKAQVTNVAVLNAALAVIEEKQAAFDAVAAKIDAIPALNALTPDDEATVIAAREAYDALADDIKAAMNKIDVLVAAEARIVEFKQETIDLQLNNFEGDFYSGNVIIPAGNKGNVELPDVPENYTANYTEGNGAAYTCWPADGETKKFHLSFINYDEAGWDFTGAKYLVFDLYIHGFTTNWVSGQGDQNIGFGTDSVWTSANLGYIGASTMQTEVSSKLKEGWNHVVISIPAAAQVNGVKNIRFYFENCVILSTPDAYALIDDLRILNTNGWLVDKVRNQAKTVISQIALLDDPYDTEAIEAAKAAYAALTEEQQAYVTNYGRFAELEQAAIDMAAAAEVDALIEALPEAADITLEDKAAVDAAQDAYDALSDSAKTYVALAEKLAAAQEAIYNLENPPVEGTWAKTLFGVRFYIGDEYFEEGWLTVDGNDYYFENGYRYEGIRMVQDGTYRWFNFGEDGICSAEIIADGFYTDAYGMSYVENGVAVNGLKEIEGKYYYFAEGYAKNNGTYEGLYFEEDYAAFSGIVDVDGTATLYINGAAAAKGLYEVDGAVYYADWGGVLRTGKVYVSETYCNGLVEANKDYNFGEDGKLLSGVVYKDGVPTLYVNGNTTSKGVYEVNGDIYFADWGGVLLTGKVYVSETFCNGVLDGNKEYTFGADGKLLNGVVDKDGVLTLYVNGNTTAKGVFEVNGDIYFADWGGVLNTDGVYYVSNTFCNDVLEGGKEYTFGADGKLMNGAYDVNGVLTLYVNGVTTAKGLFEVNGDIYFADWGGVLNTDGVYYVSNTFCNDVLPGNVNYTFGADGKLLNGAYDVDGVLTLYVNGVTTSKGVFEVNGDIYYADWGGVLNVDGTYFVSETYCNGILAGGANYTFGADGKILNGFVTTEEGIYYYENGNIPAAGIIEVDGDYYCVGEDGKLLTNGTYYVTNGNGYTIEMEYVFDETGKIIG